MKYLILLSLVATALIYTPAQTQTGSFPGQAGSCNCQLNSVQSLRALIHNEVQAQVETEVAARLATTPVLGLLYIARTGDSAIVLSNISGVTVRGIDPRRAQLPMFNSSAIAVSNNLLAYHPNYRDSHRSGIAAVFINMVEAFLCIRSLFSFLPVCKVFPYEDDGFRGGRVIIEASDGGNGFRVFNGTLKGVFGFGFTGCLEMNTTCFPRYAEYVISCFLPRNLCG